MSDDTPENPFDRHLRALLHGMRPTPEVRLNEAKMRVAKWNAALPHVRAARAAMRELDILGFRDATGHTDKISRRLALLDLEIESALAWPVEP